MGFFSWLKRVFGKRKVLVQFDSAVYVYDGAHHELSYSVQGLPTGYAVRCFDIYAPVDVTDRPVEAACKRCAVFRDERDVSHRFEVEVRPGVIEVQPSRLVISSASAEKIYDGADLIAPQIEISGLQADDSLSVRATGTLRNVGTVENDIEIDWGASTAKRSNYEIDFSPGTLTIEPARLYVNAYDAEYVYDGLPHAPQIQIPEGANIEYSGPSSFVDAGCYSVEYSVSMANHESVRGVASVRILPAPITMISASATQAYSGKSLRAPDVTIEGIPEGERLIARACGSQLHVGRAENLIVIDWDSFAGKRENYDVRLRTGVLEVTPAKLEVQTLPVDVVYDGKEHSFEVAIPDGANLYFEGPDTFSAVGEYREKFIVECQDCETFRGIAHLTISEFAEPIRVVTVGGEFEYDGREHGASVEEPMLPLGYTLKEARSTASVKNVCDGSVQASCDVLSIVNVDGDDVTARLNIEYLNSHIAIAPKELYVFTLDASREWNGKPLSASGRLSGLVEGETVSFSVTGSQTEVGESVNSYSLVFNGTAKRDNYSIREVLGRLKVLESSPGTKKKEGYLKPADAETGSTNEQFSQPKRLIAQKDSNSEVEWKLPRVEVSRRSASISTGEERRRRYAPRPVGRRSGFEEAGLGHGFMPFGLDAPKLADNVLRSTLRDLESRAREEIDRLIESEASPLLFECFEPLEDSLGEIGNAMQSLFSCYRYDQRFALAWAYRYCRNAFMVYVAALAHDYYDESALWDRLFEAASIRPEIRSVYKQTFVSCVYQRGLPVYERNEVHAYMTYTALLHAGFSRAVWKVLWSSALLPMAQDGELPRDASGSQIILHVAERFERHSRNRAVSALLKSAPAAAMEESFKAAWAAALQLMESQAAESAFVNSRNLPPDAGKSLYDAIGAPKQKVGKKAKRKAPILLNGVDLEFDFECGEPLLVWNACEASSDLLGFKAQFIVNGELVHTALFEPIAGATRLRNGSTRLKPNTNYQVEIQVSSDGQGGVCREIASYSTNFACTRQGIAEFVMNSRGKYLFRNRRVALSSAKRIVYLIPLGIEICPQRGMEKINESNCCGKWLDYKICEYMVQPGATACAFDLASGEIVSAWSEGFRVRIDASSSIGAIDGYDLYGHVLGRGETDVALPIIRMDALAGEPTDDVEVRFIRDGEEGKLDARWIVDEIDGSAALQLSFPTLSEGRGIARACSIEVRRRSTKDLLLHYRFGIVPIQGLRLEDYKTMPGTGEFFGIYTYEATESLHVKDIYGASDIEERVLARGEQDFFEAKLSSESLVVAMEDSAGRCAEVQLFLAGIEIEMPNALLKRAERVSYLGYPSVSELGYSNGLVRVHSHGNREARMMRLYLGQELIAKKRLLCSEEIRVNIFDDPRRFIPQGGMMFKPMDLTLSITYGFRFSEGKRIGARAIYGLLKCGKGLEFEDCTAVVRNGKDCLRFRAPKGCEAPSCPVRVEFISRSGVKLGHVDTDPGVLYVEMPRKVSERYSTDQMIRVRIIPLDLFGEADEEAAVQCLLKIEK